jgi:hypothetical protein
MKKNQPPAQQLVFQFNVLQVAVNLPGASMYATSQERAVPDVPSMTKPAKTRPAKAKTSKSNPSKKTCQSKSESTNIRTVTRTNRKTTSKTNTKTNQVKVAKRTDDRRWKN